MRNKALDNDIWANNIDKIGRRHLIVQRDTEQGNLWVYKNIMKKTRYKSDIKKLSLPHISMDAWYSSKKEMLTIVFKNQKEVMSTWKVNTRQDTMNIHDTPYTTIW